MTSFLVKRFIKNYKNYENPDVRSAYGKFAGIVGIVLNIILFIIKLVAGILTKSVSVTADAVNNLSDSASSIVSLFGFKLAEKPADEEHPYGHGRYEYISALTVTVIIFVIGFELLKSGIGKIINPSSVECNAISISILIISIILKLWMSFFNRKIGKNINSKTLLATATDSINDVFSTSAVLLSVVISFIFKINLDGFMGVLVAILILISSFRLMKDTLSTLLGNAPDEEFVERIEKKIMSYPCVLGTHDLIVHDYGPGRLFASVHIEVAAEKDVLESHDCIDNIERYFLNEEGLNIIVHMDPIVTKDEAVGDIRRIITDGLKKLDSALSIHDLRVVPGTTHTNVIFDCVVPLSSSASHSEIKEKVKEILESNFESHYPVITFEQNYTPIPKNVKKC